jgi:hypothetical protein
MQPWRECQATCPERPDVRCSRQRGHSQWHSGFDAEREYVEWDARVPHWAPNWKQERREKDEAADGARYESGRGMDTERDNGRVWRWW